MAWVENNQDVLHVHMKFPNKKLVNKQLYWAINF